MYKATNNIIIKAEDKIAGRAPPLGIPNLDIASPVKNENIYFLPPYFFNKKKPFILFLEKEAFINYKNIINKWVK